MTPVHFNVELKVFIKLTMIFSRFPYASTKKRLNPLLARFRRSFIVVETIGVLNSTNTKVKNFI